MSSLAETFIPRDWQAQIIGDPRRGIPENKSKYKVVVAHRKGGKTVMGLMYLFYKAATCTEIGTKKGMRVPRFTYIGPTYKQAKDIAWDMLKDIVPSSMLLKKPNETNLEIRLKNGVILNLKGADKEDSLRGPGLYFALMDEYAFMRPGIWQQVIQPELASTDGEAMFIGTPFGRDHFYEVFKNGRDGIDNWSSWRLPSTEEPFGFDPSTKRGQDLLAPGWIEEVKSTSTEKFYRQEYECDFADNAGMVFDRVDENVVDEFREFPEAGHAYRIGFDPALREDWSVMSVIDLTDHKFKYVYRTNKIDAELLYTKVENMVNTWTTNLGKPEVFMDTTGMGDPMYDTLISRALPIHPIKFSNKSKTQMVDNLAIKFNKDAIKIPRYEWLIDEIKDYRYERTITGRYKYGAPPGKHDDGVTSLMLACWELPPQQAIAIGRSNGGNMQGYTPNKYTGY